MEEVRIDIKKNSKRHWLLIIGSVLFFGSIIWVLISLIFGKFGWAMVAAYVGWWGIVALLFELSDTRKIPQLVLLSDDGIKFKHFLGYSKYQKYARWADIKEIWPSNYIELKNGKKIIISYMDSYEFDQCIDYLINLNLTHLLKGKIGQRMNVNREGPMPDVTHFAEGKEVNMWFMWVLVLILSIPLTFGAFFIGVASFVAGIWTGGVAFLFIAGLLAFLVFIAFFFLFKQPRQLSVKVSPEGIMVDEKGKPSQLIDWGNIDRIENTLDSAVDVVIINLRIYKKNGESFSFTNHVIGSKEHGKLFVTMSKYCFYFGIPIIDNVGYLNKELASSSRSL